MMELGILNNPFEYDYKKYYNIVTHSWMKYLWEFCCIRKVTLRNIVPKFTPNQKKDKNLMESFTNNGLYGLQLAVLNRC